MQQNERNLYTSLGQSNCIFYDCFERIFLKYLMTKYFGEKLNWLFAQLFG